MHNTSESVRQLFNRSITAKVVVIAVLLLLFIVPSFMVGALVQERSIRHKETIGDVGSTWGRAQAVVGPILTIPYVSSLKTDTIGAAYFLPEQLEAKSVVTVEKRSRGIYEVPVYEQHVEITGFFNQPNFAALNINPARFLPGDTTAIIGIPDLRGVKSEIIMELAGREYRFMPGVPSRIITNGVSIGVSLPSGVTRIPFRVTVDLRGSEVVAFSPIGKTTKIAMESNWPSPSFIGSFLPVQRTLTDAGFTAEWELLDLNRSFPQQWTGEDRYSFFFDNYNLFNSGIQGDLFGVEFLLPVDVYDKTGRSVRYAIAVIALVFASVFFTEATSRRRVHPVQYLLIGLALVIFYTLLLSLAEYIPFGFAYLIASAAIIGMVTLFTRSVTQSTRLGLVNGGILTALYGFVYVLLQMEDFTLLIGSIGLFVILAVMMFVSRKINWYGTEDGQQ